MLIQIPSIQSSVIPLFLFLITLEASFVTSSNPLRSQRRSAVQPYAPNGLNAGVYHTTLKSSCKIPQATKVITVDTPIKVGAGETFDCKLAKYQRTDRSCNLDVERGGDQAVFILQEGATLKNCILGYSQESVYCRGQCTLENCHWLQICDEAIAFYMPSGKATVNSCSFSNAGNKALQFNGGGTVTVNNSCFNNVDIAYRSCGKKCSTAKRAVVFNHNTIDGVNTFAGYNEKHGDTAHIASSSGQAIKHMCEAKDSDTPKGHTPAGCTFA